MGIAEIFTFFNTWLNKDVLIVLGAVSALGVSSAAYFKSGAADGKLTVEDFIAIAVISILGAAMAYGIYAGVK